MHQMPDKLLELIGEHEVSVRTVGPLTLILEPIEAFYSVSIGMSFVHGSVFEPDNLLGITHFIEHMAFKGTEDKNYLELSRELDLLGGNFNAFTSKELVTFYGKVIHSNLERALELLFEIAFKPSFPEEEIEKEKKVVLEEIAMAMDQPEELLVDLYYKMIYRDHPLSNPVIGTEDTVRSFSRDLLVSYHRQHFTPSKMIVSLCGRFSPDEVVSTVTRLCERFCPNLIKEEPKPRLEHYPTPEFHYSQMFRHHSSKEAYVIYGTEGAPQSSPDRFKWIMLETILGGGTSSKLFIELREKRGLVYTVSTFHQAYAVAGTFGISFITNPNNLTESLDTVRKVLSAPEEVTGTDMEIARAQMLISLALSYESSFSRMFSNLKSYFYLGRVQSPDELMSELQKVSLDDVRELLSELSKRDFSLAVVSSENVLNLAEYSEEGGSTDES